jgi:two-component system phosphate regulon sensor histidine kinase PhoR
MLKIKSRLLLLIITLFISALISFVSLLLLFGIDNIDYVDFTKVFLLTFLVVYILGNVYTRSFLYSKLKEISKDILPEKNISQTVTTNMEELVSEIKDYDSKRKSEFSEMKKLESFRREFIGNLAHEIKTPLFTSQSYILTLLDGALKDENVNIKYLKTASKAIDRLNLIVKDLDLITKIESGESILNKNKFDIINLTENVFEMLEFTAKKKKIKLTVNKDKGLLTKVIADKEKIEQVLTNLIDNSIKYGKDHGTTEIVIQSLNEDKIIVRVTDNGVGFKKENYTRIFERFFRVDRSGSRSAGGSGLGLAIVKHIIDAHDEKIYVESEFGVGSEFSFTLEKSK